MRGLFLIPLAILCLIYIAKEALRHRNAAKPIDWDYDWEADNFSDSEDFTKKR